MFREEKQFSEVFPNHTVAPGRKPRSVYFQSLGVSQWAVLTGWYFSKLELWEGRGWATFFFLYPGNTYYVEDTQLMLGGLA